MFSKLKRKWILYQKKYFHKACNFEIIKIVLIFVVN